MESSKLSTMYNKRNTMLNIHNRGKYVLSSSDKSSPRHCSTALKSDAVMYPRLCLSNTCNRTERIATEIFFYTLFLLLLLLLHYCKYSKMRTLFERIFNFVLEFFRFAIFSKTFSDCISKQRKLKEKKFYHFVYYPTFNQSRLSTFIHLKWKELILI